MKPVKEMKGASMVNKVISERLAAFADEHGIHTKGTLSLVLVLTRRAAGRTPPYDPRDFLTPKGGQVAGLGGPAVQSVLADHGIARVLAEEGGRTSRGSLGRMTAYMQLLNEMHASGTLDFLVIEKWWVERVNLYFATKPLRLKMDSSNSLRSIVARLIETAFERQRETPGMMLAGAVMQHLVGAKLEMILPEGRIEHQGFSTADAPGARKGDFLVGDTAIHVTTAPTEALIRKCIRNLEENIRPLIVTTMSGAGGASALAKNADAAERIEILEIDQFIAANVYEWSGFEHAKRSHSMKELVEAYNRIIDQCETDPSMRIAIG
ncbi:DUF4928 family protein [Desulfonatronum thiodismutans]|uniref:DUF4928 family protein n=1 Tax=Desulfonatronum thiodismutans TaxID=159290 RepID=UPI000A8256C2|nr:DUF4928 family protein [Desulfonatronum thiodismutans]